MDVPPPTPGIRTEPAPPAAPVPAVSLPTPAAPNVELPSPWPRAAQRVTVAALALALGLLAWHTYAAGRWSTRPTTLEPEAAFRVDLNQADHARLLQLPGVGESLARRIGEYREEHGGFRDVSELRRVPGIGPATLERLRPLVYVQPLTDSEDEDLTTARAPAAPPNRPAAEKRPVGKKAETLAGRVDVNRATAEELQRLPGIGPALASRVIATREAKPFAAVDDLRRVPGIGPKTLERLRPFVTVGAAADPGAADDGP